MLGASRPEQLQSNLAALDVRPSAEQLRTLDDASIVDPVYDRMWTMLKGAVFGANTVQG